MKDTYRTISSPSEETLFKDKNSKFFGYAFPVTTEEEIKEHIEALKKKHHSARHHCYAWQLGTEQIQFRANDDGEPSNSAGQPIYGQIQSFDVTNILIVSVRYFGGIKLGVGGLINAYKTSAQITLEASDIVERIIEVNFELRFAYDMMNNVQRVIKEKQLRVVNQVLEMDCKYIIATRKKESEMIFEIFKNMYKVEIKEVE